jgi:manganese-dependent inorganic pyrophosphatase
MTFKRRPTKNTAGLLLCAILSDTLNLQVRLFLSFIPFIPQCLCVLYFYCSCTECVFSSLKGPTTTEWDRLMVTVLVEIAEVDDIQFLATQQFKAKSSELAGLSCNALVNGDQKVFSFKTQNFDGSVGFAVVETTDDEIILSRTEEILIALSHDKEQKCLSVLFLAVVNIVSLQSTLLLCGPNERALAEASFKEGKIQDSSPFVMDLGNLVSRKKDFIPAVTKAIKLGWSLASKYNNA